MNHNGMNADDGMACQDSNRLKRWLGMCTRFSDFLDDNQKVPTPKDDRHLYQWFYKQKAKFDKGSMQDDRQEAFEKLLARIKTISQNATSENTWITLAIKKEYPFVKQEDLWNQKWQAYMDFIEKNKRHPFRNHEEEMVLFDWFKHSKKLLNQGKMRADRIAKFKQLLDESLKYQCKFKGNNVASTAKAEEPSIHLYVYQADMMNRIEQAFQEYNSVMVQMPTGTGKTHIIAAVTKEFVSKDKNVWIVAHRRELVTQIRNTLGMYLTKKDMGLVEVRSVQWLTRHIGEMKSLPSLIVIDEAHHALAKTYSFLIKSFPEAKKLGVTATPYRLSGESFTDLFDTLLVSKGVYDFMIDGRLSLYDYYSVKEDDEDLQLIKSIRKRGTDGDYDAKELDSKYNQTKTIEHLFASFQRYAAGCKGFIYAMNIKHAENIASYYVSKGVKLLLLAVTRQKRNVTNR